MGGTRISDWRSGLGALALLAAISAVDVSLGKGLVLISLLAVAPLVASLSGPPRATAAVAALTFVVAVPMGAVDHILFSERHVVALVVVAVSGAVSVLSSIRRAALAAMREQEASALSRISLLDRSTRLIRSPMDFRARLSELSRLPIPDVADLCIIDLATADGRLEGVVASATDPEIATLVEETRRASPLDPRGQHPVAVALRSGEPQLRGAMTDDELKRYASSETHLELMRRLQYSSAIVVPIVARGRTLGVLSVLRLGHPVPFGDADLTLMSDLAGRAAIAVDNARLFEEAHAAEARLQGVLDNLAEAVMITGAAGELIYANQAGAELIGHASTAAALEAGSAQMFADYELFDEEGAPLDVGRVPARRVMAGEEAPPMTIRRRHRASGEERWLTIKATAVPDPATGAPAMAVNVIEDVTDERRARANATFLSEASKLLAGSLDYEETLQGVAQAAVPHLADWCGVELLTEDGLQNVAVAHVDPAKVALARQLREEYPGNLEGEGGMADVLRTGRSTLIEDVPPELYLAAAVDDRHRELLEALEMTSVLIVPMVSGERIIGAITFLTTGARRLGEADREVAEELGRRAAVAVENARIHRERTHVAMTLQRSLLPPRLPVVPGLALAARFRAAGEANQVGGDFYDLFAAGDRWLVVIGDVTGKGPDAAAITSLARYTLRTAALYEADPRAIVRRLNQALLAEGEQRQMCTAACLLVTPGGEGEPIGIELVCAGHPPPYLLGLDSGAIEALCRPGPLLGAFADADWEPARLELRPGQAVVLYTDGVTDARGAEDRFGQERLEAVLRDASGGGADEIAEAVDEALMDFQDGPQRDDVALLVLRAGEGPGGPETSVVAESASTDV